MKLSKAQITELWKVTTAQSLEVENLRKWANNWEQLQQRATNCQELFEAFLAMYTYTIENEWGIGDKFEELELMPWRKRFAELCNSNDT